MLLKIRPHHVRAGLSKAGWKHSVCHLLLIIFQKFKAMSWAKMMNLNANAEFGCLVFIMANTIYILETGNFCVKLFSEASVIVS